MPQEYQIKDEDDLKVDEPLTPLMEFTMLANSQLSSHQVSQEVERLKKKFAQGLEKKV